MRYKDFIKKILTEENVSGGTGGAFTGAAGTVDAGSTGGSVGNVDSYAPGDARNVIGTKGKKKKKIPLYRRNKVESIFLGNLDECIANANLTCSIIINNDQFIDITRTYLEKIQVEHKEETENDSTIFMFSGTDDEIVDITDRMPGIIGELAFETGECMILMGEMSE
jgi:hypothetical protein